jgi:hypothetical protein
LPADLVTRDTELGLAWLRLRHPKGKLPYVDFGDAAKVVVGTQLYTVMRTSDQYGSVPIVRAGYVLGETTVPRQTYLIEGAPGLAFDGDGKPAGFVDVDLGGMMRSRSSSSGIGMDFGDLVLSMIPADRIGRVTKQASVLPVVKSTDTDDGEPQVDTTPAPTAHKQARLAPAAPSPSADGSAKQPAVHDPATKDPPAKDAADDGTAEKKKSGGG